jgi:hypothetical protein
MMAAWNSAWKSKQVYAPSVVVHLTQDEEDKMVCWLRQNPFLYEEPVTSVVFVARHRACKLQADVLGIPLSDLHSWFQLQVHVYASLCLRQKLETTATTSMRGQEAWVLANFNFLHRYVLGFDVSSAPKMPVLRPAGP